MKINNAGIKLIKSFEGCRLKAYQDSAGVWTIGWGHTGNVKAGQIITQAKADEYLMKDIAKFEKAVNALGIDFNENQFSALVSFAYNCGTGNLKKLCNGRTKPEIGSKMLLYDKAGGKSLAGLARRRKAENGLYNKPITVEIYEMPVETLKKGMSGDGVRWLQQALNRKGYSLTVDGVFGNATENAVKDFQSKVFSDGIVGIQTKTLLTR